MGGHRFVSEDKENRDRSLGISRRDVHAEAVLSMHRGMWVGSDGFSCRRRDSAIPSDFRVETHPCGKWQRRQGLEAGYGDKGNLRFLRSFLF